MKIKVSLDIQNYLEKPKRKEMAGISMRIAQNKVEEEPEQLGNLIGNQGHTFCPAVFTHGERKKDDFREMELFVLDFDEGTTYRVIRERAEQYGIPVCFAYYTFSSSSENERFRVVFRHSCPVKDARGAKIILSMLAELFPECDKSCIDVARMFLGGKELIELGSGTFNIEELAMSVQLKIKNQSGNNYSRDLKKFARGAGIAMNGSSLAIFDVLKVGEIEEITAQPIYIQIGRDADSSKMGNFHEKIYRVYLAGLHQPLIRQTNEKIYKVSHLEERGCACMLLSDFMNKVDIDHAGRFLLMCNLRFIKGGETLFLNQIRENGNDFDAWKTALGYIKDNHYKPVRCSECIYADTCENRGTMLATVRAAEGRKIETVGDKEYISLEEASVLLEENIREVVENPTNGMYLIKAQTAIGKTHAYCRLIASQRGIRKFIVACPTNRLKEEVADRLRKEGVECVVAPSVDDWYFPAEIGKQIREYYDAGIDPKTRCLLEQYMKENEKEENEIYWSCRNYLETLIKMKTADIIVTTHARLMHFTKGFLKKYTVIIDEDILMSYIMKQIKCVMVSDVVAACESDDVPDRIKPLLKKILHAEEGVYVRIEPDLFACPIGEDVLRGAGLVGRDSNLNGFLRASAFVKRKDGSVLYFCPESLPEGKYIILSATFDRDIYERYFRGHPIFCMESSPVKYAGRLIQYSYYSLGRGDLQDKFDRIREMGQKLLGKDVPVITFKSFSEKTNPYGLYYGNLAGCDKLCGKDVVLIGTPFTVDENYKLFTCHLGEDVNRKEDEQPRWGRITYHGYCFYHTTYHNELLRQVQLYCISSELEQAVGRARILRKDCTVVLFSNFPCEQAEFRTEDYLAEKS